MKEKRHSSLKTTLTVWFLFLSVVPLACLTVYSVYKYRDGIEKELYLRGRSNIREFKALIESFQTEFRVRADKFVKDRSLIYYISTSDVGRAETLVTNWMRDFEGSKMSLIRDDGVFLFSAKKKEEGGTKIERRLWTDTYKLSGPTLVKLQENKSDLLLLVKSSKQLHLIHNKRVYRSPDKSVGFIEQALTLSQKYISNFGERIGSMVFVLDAKKGFLTSSHRKVESIQFSDIGSGGEVSIDGKSYGLFLEKVTWGDDFFYVGLGVSKEEVNRVVSEITIVFVSVAITMMLLLGVLIYFVTSTLLQPLSKLVQGLESLPDESEPSVLEGSSKKNEVGILIDSFNNMSKKVSQARQERLEKINELESANRSVRETQAQLVQSAKMASLGQLVAGVAHELNNPIGYISSNITYLKDYVGRLHKIIDQAGENLSETKKENDYEFIKEDLQKLINSYEEGAKRTKEIVFGLRSFSRMDEANLKSTDLQAGIENTLLLLGGEVKSRVTVHKNFGDIPQVMCFPSAINQVFMNVLQNAIQAIDGNGEIWIYTELVAENRIQVKISDSGIGMSPETIEKIFEPFYTTKDVGEGTGLGMSITYGIVRNHGGEIRVESELGRGSSFIITLPIDGP